MSEFKNLILRNYLIGSDKVFPHENVIEERKNKLLYYLKSNYEEIVIPSILICSKSRMIIDGHHRYYSLIELGFNSIPVTEIEYFDSSIITHPNKKLSLKKELLIERSLKGEMFPPKTTIHRIKKNQSSQPLILLSKLSLIN